MSLLIIRLAYDPFHTTIFLFLQTTLKQRKQSKLKLIFIIYHELDYKDRSLSKHLKQKDRTKLLFN